MSRSRKKTVVILAATAAAVAAAAVWLYVESTSTVVKEIRVNLPRFGSADDGFAVAILSDTHFHADDGPRAKEISRIVEKLAPDMIFLLGDFINGSPDRRKSLSMEELTDFFSSLHAKYGVFAVTGNHELWYGREQVKDALRRGGAEVLSGRTRLVTLPSGQRLQLAGLPDSSTEFTLRPPVVAAGLPTIALMHDPHAAELLPENFAFGVAGHTHGGQLRLLPDGGDRTSLRLLVQRIKGKLGLLSPYNRPLVLFDRWFTSFRYRRLFITAGLGCERIRLRMFCRPEIVLMRLYAADPRAATDTYAIPEEI